MSEDLVLTAYALQGPLTPLVPASIRRAWMDETPAGFANRCLPMLIANQSGWVLLNRGRVQVTWNGGLGSQDVTIDMDDPDTEAPQSHFGSGLITWRIPYLFRTPPGWNLLIRGPANQPKDGASSLEGIVETDWAVAPAFHTWQLTRPGTVVWEDGEPICMIVPQRRGEVEAWTPEVQDVYDHPELRGEYLTFSEDRRAFNADRPGAWQKHYFRGTSPGTARAPDGSHETRLRVRPFDWRLLTPPPTDSIDSPLNRSKQPIGDEHR